jgi:carbon-monoxide dehydrogenase large subunit
VDFASRIASEEIFMSKLKFFSSEKGSPNFSLAQQVLVSPESQTAECWVGKRIKRKEDLRLISGRGTYVDDLNLPFQLHVAILRSPYAHAKIKSIKYSKALAYPGVKAVLTGEEVFRKTKPFSQLVPPPGSNLRDYCLAVDKVRFVGEPVAAVAAETKAIAEDALELIEIEYQELEPIISPEQAVKDESSLVHEEVGSNILWHEKFDYGNVELAFKEADLVVSEKLHFHRFSSMPLETNAILVDWNVKSEQLTVWSNNHMPMFSSLLILEALNIDSNKLRLITPDAGGHFGIKVANYPYIVLLSLLSMKTGRPVKWSEDRREHIAAGGHGSERIFDVKMAVKNDGTILGFKLKSIDDEGAYLRYEPVGVILWVHVAGGAYKIRNASVEVFSVATNKCPVTSNRGYGRMQHLYMLERMMDIVSKKIGIDPIEIRLRNYIQPEEFPYETLTGSIYDSGNYPESLRIALNAIDYDLIRATQEEQSRRGRYIGIGIATVVESGTNNFAQVRLINPAIKVSGTSEAATIRIDHTGKVTAKVASVPGGQGHETVTAQIVADEFGITPDDIRVSTFDSDTHPWTVQSGTFASRFAVTGTGAILGACKKMREKMMLIAAHAMNLDDRYPEKLVFDRRLIKTADGSKSITFAEIANLAYRDTALLPDGLEPGLSETFVYKPPFKLADENKRGNLMFTYGYQTHAAVVEVDLETGITKILKYVIVHDCGKQLNPLIVEGQVQGSVAHSIYASLFEDFKYEPTGQLLSSTFVDYLVPTAEDAPSMEIIDLETPSPFSPLGVKGCGEGAGGPIPTLVNAIEDALAQIPKWKDKQKSNLTESHCSPENIYAKIHSA